MRRNPGARKVCFVGFGQAPDDFFFGSRSPSDRLSVIKIPERRFKEPPDNNEIPSSLYSFTPRVFSETCPALYLIVVARGSLALLFTVVLLIREVILLPYSLRL